MSAREMKMSITIDDIEGVLEKLKPWSSDYDGPLVLRGKFQHEQLQALSSFFNRPVILLKRNQHLKTMTEAQRRLVLSSFSDEELKKLGYFRLDSKMADDVKEAKKIIAFINDPARFKDAGENDEDDDYYPDYL